MSEVITLVIGLFIAIIIFLAFRGIVLWYWNINAIILNQNRTNDLLKAMLKEMQGEKVEEPVELEETKFKPIVPHQR